jgi:hypothetical protein
MDLLQYSILLHQNQVHLYVNIYSALSQMGYRTYYYDIEFKIILSDKIDV